MQQLPPGFVLDPPQQSNGLPPGFVLDQQEQPPAQNRPVRDFFEDLSTTRITPGDRPGLADFAANAVGNIGLSLIDRPVETLTYPLTAPQRAVSGFIGASEDLAMGNFGEAGRQALEGATAVGETGLLFAPGASAASRAATIAPRPAATAAQQFVKDATRVGVRTTLPAAYPSTAGRIAKPLSENVVLGATTRDQARKVVAETREAVENTASLYSDADYRQAGRSAVKGATDQLETRTASVRAASPFMTFREKSNFIYDKVFSKIDVKAQYDPQATRSVLAEVTQRFDAKALNEAFYLPTSSKIADTLANGGKLSVNDIHKLRTTVRQLSGINRLDRTLDDVALERLEGSLTEDLFKAIEQTSGKAAAKELRVADRYYRQNITSIKQALKPFFKQGATPEDAFSEIIASSRGVRGDIRQIRALRRSLTPQQMDDVSAGIIRQLGKPQGKDLEFSFETFSNNWKNINPEAKAALFNRAQRPDVREQLDALANIIDRNAQVEALANRSQSAAGAGNLASYGALFFKPEIAIPAAIGANATGRLLMSPSFTRMLVNLERRSSVKPLDLSRAKDRAFVYGAITTAENSDTTLKPYLRDLRDYIDSQNDNLVQQKSAEQ